MSPHILQQLSRRERQIMEAIYRLKGGTVSEVRDALSDPPSYSAVRTHLGILEEKGLLRHKKHGRRYVYHPTLEKAEARRSALRHVLETFFDGSVTATVGALLADEDRGLSESEVEHLEALIKEAREREERES